MKCKNCGAQYRMRELRCPYCETENLIGRVWLIRRTEAVRKYEEDLKKARKRFIPYVVSKVVNRLILLAVLLVLVTAGLLIWQHTGRRTSDGKRLDERMEELFEAGDYYQLYLYMDEKDIFREAPEAYTQSALLANHYNEFITRRLQYLPEDVSEWDVTYVEMVMREAMDVYTHRMGVYKDEWPQNEPQYELYRGRILAFWKGTMMCTDEEVDWLADEESWWHSEDLRRLCEELKNRRLQADEKE